MFLTPATPHQTVLGDIMPPNGQRASKGGPGTWPGRAPSLPLPLYFAWGSGGPGYYCPCPHLSASLSSLAFFLAAFLPLYSSCFSFHFLFSPLLVLPCSSVLFPGFLLPWYFQLLFFSSFSSWWHQGEVFLIAFPQPSLPEGFFLSFKPLTCVHLLLHSPEPFTACGLSSASSPPCHPFTLSAPCPFRNSLVPLSPISTAPSRTR